jgi:hypothetical protein
MRDYYQSRNIQIAYSGDMANGLSFQTDNYRNYRTTYKLNWFFVNFGEISYLVINKENLR